MSKTGAIPEGAEALVPLCADVPPVARLSLGAYRKADPLGPLPLPLPFAGLAFRMAFCLTGLPAFGFTLLASSTASFMRVFCAFLARFLELADLSLTLSAASLSFEVAL